MLHGKFPNPKRFRINKELRRITGDALAEGDPHPAGKDHTYPSRTFIGLWKPG